MHDINSWTSDSDAAPVDLQTAIDLIEAGEARTSICVDLGDGVLARANGRLGLPGLLQRLRGHRLIQSLARSQHEDILAMPPGDIDVHPIVAEILDALKD